MRCIVVCVMTVSSRANRYRFSNTFCSRVTKVLPNALGHQSLFTLIDFLRSRNRITCGGKLTLVTIVLKLTSVLLRGVALITTPADYSIT